MDIIATPLVKRLRQQIASLETELAEERRLRADRERQITELRGAVSALIESADFTPSPETATFGC